MKLAHRGKWKDNNWKRPWKMAKQKKSKGRVVDFNKALEKKQKKRREEELRHQEEQIEISEVSESAVKRRKIKKRRRAGIYALVVVIVLAIFGLLLHNVISLKMEQHDLQAKKEQLEKKKKELQEEKKAVSDKDYIEEQARKQLKMIRPGEILYVLPDDGDTDKDKEQNSSDDKDGGD